MKTLGLLEFFNMIGYDWHKDEENIKTICHYTKTRVDKSKVGRKNLNFGTTSGATKDNFSLISLILGSFS